MQDHNIYTAEQRNTLLRKLKSETLRLSTFRFWRSQNAFPNKLAKAGFFYFNVDDRVQCAFCLDIIGQWESFDIPHHEHKKHFPKCPFINNIPVGNIPTQKEEEKNIHNVIFTDILEDLDVTGKSTPLSEFKQNLNEVGIMLISKKQVGASIVFWKNLNELGILLISKKEITQLQI